MEQRTEPFDAEVQEFNTVRCINGRAKKLPPHKHAKKRGLLTGRRRVSLWDVEGDDSFAVEFQTGKHLTRLRLSREALDALVALYRYEGGPWHFVYRVMLDEAAKADGAS